MSTATPINDNLDPRERELFMRLLVAESGLIDVHRVGALMEVQNDETEAHEYAEAHVAAQHAYFDLLAHVPCIVTFYAWRQETLHMEVRPF